MSNEVLAKNILAKLKQVKMSPEDRKKAEEWEKAWEKKHGKPRERRDWWESLDKAEKAEYRKNHPKSKKSNMSNMIILAKNLRLIAKRLEEGKPLTKSAQEEAPAEDLELNELIKSLRQRLLKVKNIPALGKLTVLLSPENFRVRTIADQANLILNAPEAKIDVTDFINSLKKIRAKKNMPGVKALDAMLNWAISVSPSDVKITLKNISRIKNILKDAREAEQAKQE